MRTAIVTISNSKSRGEGEDTGGAALATWAEGVGAELIGRDLIPDDEPARLLRSGVTVHAPACCTVTPRSAKLT